MTSYSINGDAKTLTTSTDMFYPIDSGKVVTLKNTDDKGILSVTKLKLFGANKPATITEEMLTNVLLSMGYKSEPSEPVDADGITLTKDAMNVAIGSEKTLEAIVTPENAADKTVTWSVDNGKVAAVDADGTVRGLSAGKATVTATTVNGFTATCSVTVVPAQPKLIDAVSAGKGRVEVTWEAVEGATEYVVYLWNGERWKEAGSVNGKKTSCIVKGLKSGEEYTFTVRAYAKVKGETYKSAFDETGIVGRP